MKTGLFSIGLDTYRDQFDGLLDNLMGYHSEIRNRIADMGIDVIDAGMVDNPEKSGGGAIFTTVQDCACLAPVSKVTGGRRYPFSQNGQYGLVQRCYSEDARHAAAPGDGLRRP